MFSGFWVLCSIISNTHQFITFPLIDKMHFNIHFCYSCYPLSLHHKHISDILFSLDSNLSIYSLWCLVPCINIFQRASTSPYPHIPSPSISNSFNLTTGLPLLKASISQTYLLHKLFTLLSLHFVFTLPRCQATCFSQITHFHSTHSWLSVS